MKSFLNILIVSILLFIFSCSDRKENNQNDIVDKHELKTNIEDLNRYMIRQESIMIDNYIKNQKHDFIRTGTGLRYVITEQNEGDLIKQGDLVTIKYEVSSLNGDIFYSSDNDGYKTFIVGRGGVESGLEEAVLKLHRNDSAILIIPSHLAHGLVGDGNMIPAKSTLVYKLKVIDNKLNK